MSGGVVRPTSHDGAGNPVREALLPVPAQDPRQGGGVVGVEHVGGGQRVGAVHPHVERSVRTVGEAPLCTVDLETGEAKVHQDGLHPAQAEVRQDVGQLVVDGLDEGDPVTKGSQPLA